MSKKAAAKGKTDNESQGNELDISFDEFVSVDGKTEWQEKRGVTINGKTSFVTIDAKINYKKNGNVQIGFTWDNDQITYNDKIDKSTLKIMVEGLLVARDKALELKQNYQDSKGDHNQLKMGLGQ